MARGRHERPQQSRSRLLVAGLAGAGLVVAVAVGGAVWLGRSPDDSGAQPQQPSPATTDAPGDSGPGTSVSPSTVDSSTVAPSNAAPSATNEDTARADADACTKEIATTQAVVDAARIANKHWAEHVQARSDLLAGKNPEATTKAIWKRTRLAGPADVARLEAATAAELKADGGCAKLAGKPTDACSARLAALDRAATAGRAAATDWANHLSMMAAHAAGEFGAEHAQHLWVAAWTAAPKNLNAAAEADAALAKAPACQPS